MIKSHIKGLSVFLLVNLFVFLAHYFLGKNYTHVVNIPLSYIVNAIASLAICVGMLYVNKIVKSQVGFVFLGLSFVKMIVLYFVLSPKNNADGVAIADALVIFIPFFTNLILEQLFMIKVLNIGEVLSSLRKN